MKGLDWTMQSWVVVWLLIAYPMSGFGQTNDAHTCTKSVKKTATKDELCSNFLDMTLNTSGTQQYSYTLKPGTTPVDITRLITDNDQTEMCTYERSYEETITGCCDGWKGDNCDEPKCDPKCYNNGQCVNPYICQCNADYAGNLCEDNIENYDYDQEKQYCYGSNTCHGYKAVGFDQDPVTKEKCCQSGGHGWGAPDRRCDDCSANTQDIEQKHDVGFRTCLSYGRNYFRTFDGKQFTFGSNCKHVLARATNKWHVIMHHINCEKSTTCKKKLVLSENSGNQIEVVGGIVTANGEIIQMQEQVPSFSPGQAFTVLKNGDWVMISAEKSGLRLKVNAKHTVYVTLDNSNAKLSGKIEGLCGNSNADTSDDFVTQSGDKTINPTFFGNSWIYDDDKCPRSGSVPNYCKDDESILRATEACGLMRSSIFADCRAKMSYLSWYQMCMNEYCQADTDQKETLRCDQLEMFAHECSQHGSVTLWRSQTVCRHFVRWKNYDRYPSH